MRLGGSGGGVSIQPLAFIVVANGDVKLLELGSGSSPANAIISAVPDLFTKIQGMFSKKKDAKEEAPAETADTSAEPEIEKVDINTDGFDF